MGQSASQPQRHGEDAQSAAHRRRYRRRSVRGPSLDAGQREALIGDNNDNGNNNGGGSSASDNHTSVQRPSTQRHSSHGASRPSQLLHSRTDSEVPGTEEDRSSGSRTMQMVQRTRSGFRELLNRRDGLRMRHRQHSSPPRGGILQHRMSYIRSGADNDEPDDSQLHLPPIDLSSAFDSDTFTASEQDTQLGTSASSNRTNQRFNPLRADRPFRRLASLRRRRTPPPTLQSLTGSEDQATMLSRLLSVAAAATAATLMGDDHSAMSEARSLTGGTGIGDLGGGGEDGSFEGFLRALQNGRIASALRAGTDTEGNPLEPGQSSTLNFFRMFRFRASTGLGAQARTEPQAPDNAGRRMVPVIIVGIRSIPTDTDSAASANENDPLPFIDALGSFPSPIPAQALDAHGPDSIDSILRPPQNGTSFRHRRRASMGGFGMSRNRLSDRMDDQRDHRSPDRRRERPWSVASSTSALEPRPPPATPASPSPDLSQLSSRNTTPAQSRPASVVANSLRDIGSDSRRNSILHRSLAASPLTSHSEETTSVHSTQSSANLLSPQDTEYLRNGLHAHRRAELPPNVHYPRFASGHPRRNGVVEPDHLPPLSRVSTSDGTEGSNNGRRNSSDGHSWIIYVLGGSYPENHPILTTPSLFTENPTYEDMMLLSALLGPARAPVASEEDVESAGGVYTIQISEDADKPAQLVAVASDSSSGADRVIIENGQRCLVCLCDFEVEEIARKLIKCKHLFHKECIDQWLTQGRNSCPLCRGQGVDEKEKPAESLPPSPPLDPTSNAVF